MSGRALALAAESYVGASFRLHGRDPITGFDCLGLVLVALAEIGRPVRVPLRYALRNLDLERFERLPAAAGLVEVESPPNQATCCCSKPDRRSSIWRSSAETAA